MNVLCTISTLKTSTLHACPPSPPHTPPQKKENTPTSIITAESKGHSPVIETISSIGQMGIKLFGPFVLLLFDRLRMSLRANRQLRCMGL